MNKADIRGPFVMVGASLGAHEALRFTDRHPESVVGMVLVDPDIPDRAALEERVAPKYADMRRAFGEQVVQQLQNCAAELKAGTLKPAAPEFKQCTVVRHLPDFLASVKTPIERLDANPARLLTQASLHREQYSDHDSREIMNPQRHYGDMPLIVLTAGRNESSALPPGAPGTGTPEKAAELREQVAKFLSEGWGPAHEAYAALSTRGRHQVVRDAGHNIQVDKPDAVIAAIIAVVRQRRPASFSAP